MAVSQRARALTLLVLTFVAGVAAGAAIAPRLAQSHGGFERRRGTAQTRQLELEQIPAPLERSASRTPKRPSFGPSPGTGGRSPPLRSTTSANG